MGGDLEEEEKEGRGRRGVLVRAGHGWAFVNERGGADAPRAQLSAQAC